MNVIWRFCKIVLLTIFVALPFVALWQHRNINDWFLLRGYTPEARVVELADNTQMTDLGRRLFYVHKPELNDRAAFNRNCSGFEKTIVLGCYVSNKGIFIFDVEDPRLAGIEEVTAAHEMLHAAYDRLSGKDKNNVDRMTRAAFEQINDDRINKVIESYRSRDPSVVENELHSILATEVRDLPSELEEYYKGYFHDRSAVVAFSEKYEEVFTEQQNRIQALSSQIENIEKELAAQRKSIDELEASLNADAERLGRLQEEDRIDEYNAGVNPYNAKVGHYRRVINDYNGKVQHMNRLVEEYNSLAVEQKNLINAIDSHQPSL